MPSKNSITRTVRLQKSDVKIIEGYMEKYGITFNNAVHTIINEKNYNRQQDIFDYLDDSGSATDDHGVQRAEFDCMRAKLPSKLGSKCRRCGATTNIEYHHIKPLSHGGTNDLKNIIPLCAKCHKEIHGKAANDADLLRAENERLKKRISVLKAALVAIGEE